MRKFVDHLKSQKGFTLIEMIAAITLFSMVIGIISMVTMFGFRSYHKITIENSLRDEADLIMSSIINELYVFGPQQVENTTNGLKLIKNNNNTDTIRTIQLIEESPSAEGATIGVIRLTIDNDINDPRTTIRSDLRGSTISSVSANGVECELGACGSGLINISLVLTQYYDGRAYDMEMVSKFGF